MSPSTTLRYSRAAAAMAVLAAFAAAPMAAHAADTDATGTLSAGSITNTAPAIAPFTLGLTGNTQIATTTLGAYRVTDATGSNGGWSVTVTATDPVVAGSAALAGTGASLSLTPTQGVAAPGNPSLNAPVPAGTQLLGSDPSTIQTAAEDTGQGQWDFAADTGGDENLSIVIPGDASSGAYSSTLTYTTANGAV